MKAVFDLHFHPNIYCLMHLMKKHRLRHYRTFLEQIQLDYLASTEHVYKNPLDAFRYLNEAVQDLPTSILPGVEWISREGVDIIFIYDSDSSLQYALNYLKPFKNSVWNIKGLARDTNAITIIPHPFGPGKTSLGRNLGVENHLRLSQDADYVEIQNGSVIPYFNLLLENNTLNKIPSRKLDEILFTYYLPAELIPSQVGWSIGSDAHLPATQNVFGIAHWDRKDTSDWFQFLQSRPCFHSLYFKEIVKLQLQKFLRTSLQDYLFKKYKFLRNLRVKS